MSGIIRIKKRPERYTILDNEIINNGAMTWEARGVLIYLLSKPDNWVMRMDDLVNQSPAGIKVVRRIIKELQAFRFLYRYKYQGQGGKWVWESVLFDRPYKVEDLVPLDLGGKPGFTPYTPNGDMVKPSIPYGKTVTVRPLGQDIVNTEQILTTTATAEQKKIYRLWEKNIEPLSQMIGDKLDLALEQFGYDWIEYAVSEAVENGVRNFAYVHGILQRMKSDGGKRGKPTAQKRKPASRKAPANNAPLFDPDILEAIENQVGAITGD